MKSIGLVAGQGELPLSVAREARAQGYSVTVIALKGLADESIAQLADSIEWFKLGKLDAPLKYLKARGISEIVSAGKIPKNALLTGKVSMDMRGMKFLFALRNRGDDSMLNALAREIEKDGFTIRDMKDFCQELLMPEGVLSRREPTEPEWEDIRYGFRLAKEVGRLEIGQTVVVKDKAVMAVEAIEGTDETIKRGGALAGKGATVVKVVRPGQDKRTDMPVIGLGTLRHMREAGIKVLAMESGSSIFMDQEEFIRQADKAGIAVVGISDPV